MPGIILYVQTFMTSFDIKITIGYKNLSFILTEKCFCNFSVLVVKIWLLISRCVFCSTSIFYDKVMINYFSTENISVLQAMIYDCKSWWEDYAVFYYYFSK